MNWSISKIQNKAYKTELDPTQEQVSKFMRHCEAARFAYNWALNEKETTGIYADERKMSQLFVSRKKTEFKWAYEVCSATTVRAVRNLCVAYKRYFEELAKNPDTLFGKPELKKRSHGIGSFYLECAIVVEYGRIRLPRIGWVRLKENDYIPTSIKPQHLVVSEDQCRWYVSVLFREDIEPLEMTEEAVGIDLGIKTLAVLSDGTVYKNPRFLKKEEKKLKRLQRKQSRRKKGSNRWKCSKKVVGKQYQKVRRCRKDFIHKATSEIVKTKRFKTIVIEDLNVSGMAKNKKLAKAVSDSGMREFRRQLEYKSKWYGSEIVVVSRWFPSTKTCSRCGHVKDSMPLSERIFKCENCGLVIDRDLNAAINLKNTAKSVEIYGRGDLTVHDSLGSQVKIVEASTNQCLLGLPRES